jgi:hypothetical protein
MDNIVYAICDEPYCLWEKDITNAATTFIKSIDFEYFRYIADRSSADLGNSELGMRAATSMRLALFHGGETLFLLIGALLQGHRCPHAWVGQCSTGDLRTIIERINAGQSLLSQNYRIRNLSWLSISKEILTQCPPDADGLENTIHSFAKFWELLALNHTDQIYVDEYNSLKHGFRVAPGGFEIMMGIHPSTSMPPPDQEMKSLGSSKWGATFRVIKKFENDTKGSRSKQSFQTAVNWNAEAVAFSLRLVADSIINITTHLGILNGLKDGQFHLPTPMMFELASKRVNLLSVSVAMNNRNACSTTKEQLIAHIKKNSLRLLLSTFKEIIKIRAS